MFNSYEFTFNGESSRMYGLMIYDFDGKGQGNVSFGNQASIFETRTNNRIQPLHFGVNYHKKPLEFTLVFGSMEPLDRYELESISMWLLGSQNYRWLTIDQPDLERVQFRCLVSKLTPMTHGWLPVAFEATITCDCAYAYGFPFEHTYEISGRKAILFRNESSVHEYIKPIITFNPTGQSSSLSIINEDDNGREFLIKNIPASAVVYVDNNNGIIQDTVGGINLYGGFNLNFFRLVHGDNNLVVKGDGTLTVSGRFFYNVAA